MPRGAAKEKVKKAKKVKNVPVVAVVSSEGDIQGSFSLEPRRPLIAHLPFRSTEISLKDDPLVYDPRPPGNPEPYDAFEDNLYSSNAETLEQKLQTVIVPVFPQQIKESELPKQEETHVSTPVYEELKPFRTIDVMIDFAVTNEGMSLPENTQTACFWCSGAFDGKPVVLPVSEKEGVYKVYGNFCTLACGLSHLLHEHIDSQVRWERQALFHRMYKQTDMIHPAPPKESLSFFGGSLSHAEYRDIILKKNIRVDIHLPPIISILSTLDTKPIDFYESSLKNTIVKEKDVIIQKPVDSALRLKRTKPLKDKDSTLDAVMNLYVNKKKM
jgi:hypothetical protein